jgi:1,4-dihydroxy-2-naphthoyl-CoA hydrolase
VEDPLNLEEVVKTGFAHEIGVEWLDFDSDNARARIAVEEFHLQAYAIVHGGVYSSLAESIASAATYMAVKDDGMVAIGQANDTSFLRPIAEGNITAVARRRQGGRTTWLWDVEMSDDQGRICALSRVTIAVRPMRRDRD